MDTAKMYEVALRNKLRFESPKGPLSLEHLWDVPLRSRTNFNLDTIARTASRDLKETSEESFVATRKSPKQTLAEVKLELVKHVIAVKLAEEEKAEKRADAVKRKEKLTEILERKQDAKFEEMDEAAIRKELAELDAS